jgi:hypothetical protein
MVARSGGGKEFNGVLAAAGANIAPIALSEVRPMSQHSLQHFDLT